MRTWDANKIAAAIKQFLKSEELVDPIEWLSNPDNIVLENSCGDLSLFERGIKDVYTGHYYFKSRGRSAITAGTDFLDELFNTCYNIHVVTGLVPLTHLGARWLSKRLGFKSQGIVRVHDKPYEMFIITKKEFNNE